MAEKEKRAKIGEIITIIGFQGSGKSPTAKDILTQSGILNKVVNDINEEYDENEYALFFDWENYLHYLQIVEDSGIIVEEATTVLGSHKDMDIAKLLIGIEHRRNICILLFHSIMDAPDYVLRYSKKIILYPTNDSESKIKRERDQIYPYFKKILDGQSEPNEYGVPVEHFNLRKRQ